MTRPIINVISSPNNTTQANGVITNMQLSHAFGAILESVGTRYATVNIYIGNGVNGIYGPASSGQSAQDQNTWNVYIDPSQVYAIRNANGSVRSPYFEEIVAHEIGHGMYGGVNEGPNEHRNLINLTDVVSFELGLGGSTGSFLFNAGRPIVYNITSDTDPRALRFGDGASVNLTSPTVGPPSGVRKPFSAEDELDQLYVIERDAAGVLSTDVFSPSNQLLQTHETLQGGQTSSTFFDPTNAATWSTIVTTTGTDGVIDSRVVAYDDGTSISQLYDASERVDSLTVRDAAGRVDSYTVYDDSGRRDAVTTFDDNSLADTQTVYDNAERIDSHTTYDDGQRVDTITSYDDAQRIDYELFYDDGNRTDLYLTFNDVENRTAAIAFDDALRTDAYATYDSGGRVEIYLVDPEHMVVTSSDCTWGYRHSGRARAANFAS